MKIFWFTNVLFPKVAMDLGLDVPISGGWMSALGHALSETGNIELAVATIVKGPAWKKKHINGIVYYTIPYPKGGENELIFNPGRELLKNCMQAIEDFTPDVVHIHGTEYFYGLLSFNSLIKQPTIISIQGIIGECAKVYFGGLAFKEILKCQSFYNLMRGRGLLFDKMIWHKRAKYMEEKIIKGNRNFIGRTMWDKAYVYIINPSAKYYHCDELLRTPFYSTHWDSSQIIKYSIFTSSKNLPRKGFHLLLKAVAMLKDEFPEISVKVAGDLFLTNPRFRNYITFIRELISSLGLKDFIIDLGILSAERVAQELSTAHVFAMPSLSENSSNSLAEAMLVGTPCVVSLSGGTSSMVDNGNEALGFSPGNITELAECLKRIFLDMKLAQKVSKSAHFKAQNRHEKNKIINTMLKIYEEVRENMS